ncbi:MAG TPA: cytochrome c [Nitrospira sp.]|jgi:mono/diheme cytochrome c family protein|nr:cytochrome c [Nitrospira sp.]
MIDSQPFLRLNRLIVLAASFGLLLVGGLAMALTFPPDGAWAESSTSQQATKLKGNILRGREIFNGKGACYYCHGIDGYIGRPPRLATDTAALIAKLNPPPSDLRNPEELRLKTDKERARAIREGHPGTGMFPDTTMTDQDLADTLLYLALIRKDPHPEQ